VKRRHRTGRGEPPADPQISIEFGGTAHGPVVQAGTINDGVHVHVPSPPTAGEAPVDRAARHLADAVGVQWLREEERRRVHDPSPLPVSWRLAPDTLMDHWAVIRDVRRGRDPGPLPLDGRLNDIADIYRRVPSKRLVVLGRGGSGKTVLTIRFVLDMLATRHHTDPVPVVFRLSAWDPTTTT
jgi:hypothetical protein